MTAKNGNISLILKLVLAAAVVAGVVFVVMQKLSDPVVVRPVVKGEAVSAVTGSVEVAADQGGIRPIKADVGGRVAWCEALYTGARFKKNDVLMSLDTSDLDRGVEEAKRNFASAQEERTLMLNANIEQTVAEETLANAKRLQERGELSAETVKGAERALDATKAKRKIEEFKNSKALEDHKAFLKSKEIEKERMTVRAPEDGTVKESLVWTGALISQGAPVANFISNTRLVAAKISEENFGSIKLGDPAKVRLLIYPGEAPFDAKVSKITYIADEATQRYTVFLDVHVDPARLVHGSTGQATITVDKRANALLIPRRALFNSDNVFVVKNGRAELRQVEPGFVDLNRAEVKKGVAEGELVIVEDLDLFRDGQRVRVPAAK